MKNLIIACISTTLLFMSCKKEITCPSGFYGESCTIQKTPSKIIVNKIEITRFPATDQNGAGWDLSSGADIFPVISKVGNKIWESPTYIQNADANSQHTFTLSPSVDLLNPESIYTMSLYDFDELDPNDLIGLETFVPYYSTTNNFPETIQFTGNTIDYKLYVTYVFN
jgi:hypothetical protein